MFGIGKILQDSKIRTQGPRYKVWLPPPFSDLLSCIPFQCFFIHTQVIQIYILSSHLGFLFVCCLLTVSWRAFLSPQRASSVSSHLALLHGAAPRFLCPVLYRWTSGLFPIFSLLQPMLQWLTFYISHCMDLQMSSTGWIPRLVISQSLQ